MASNIVGSNHICKENWPKMSNLMDLQLEFSLRSMRQKSRLEVNASLHHLNTTKWDLNLYTIKMSSICHNLALVFLNYLVSVLSNKQIKITILADSPGMHQPIKYM